MTADTYNSGFYDAIRAGCQASAEVIVPMLVKEFAPQRVVDVGCGEGWWAYEFAKHGCDVVGVDGDYVEAVIGDRFVFANLTAPLPDLGRFDMVVCLEVAEHLPEARAESFVADLCRLAPVVAFSAAIPFQTGAGHINCQWQSWWAQLFAANGYGVDTWIRSEIWEDERVEPWYRQNIMMASTAIAPNVPPALLDVVHPIMHGWGR